MALTTRRPKGVIHHSDQGSQYTCPLNRGKLMLCFAAGAACARIVLERAKGIEPSYAAWEAAVLPLNYARNLAHVAFQAPSTTPPVRASGKRDGPAACALLARAEIARHRARFRPIDGNSRQMA
jgi:hypothetical protein